MPDESFYAIGDIHGCDRLLAQLLDKILHDSRGLSHQIICVGDYVDRGEESAQVLRRLFALHQSEHVNLTCLIGNHEDMMLRFIEDPESHGERWLRYGGLQTLASFGVRGAVGANKASMTALRDALKEAMGAPLIAWMQSMPTQWQSGNVAVVHAGADPQLPLRLQDPYVLKWGHPRFQQETRTDDVWVLHGHTIIDKPEATNGRIAIDTGAYATGQLTAAYIDCDTARFLS
ncbi:metallophosphoesterase [Cochlodiniinecator piscidefendens]|uniref:metallophosphoesterase n=1 Tax=Cochlodiniinecator piscidefendens TaxID=2715756 RepID=UPI00140E729E|nr:metallophosphoesterase [Cochlodiniinecator piscidefendens]